MTGRQTVDVRAGPGRGRGHALARVPDQGPHAAHAGRRPAVRPPGDGRRPAPHGDAVRQRAQGARSSSASRAARVRPMFVFKAAVVGAGVMGGEIAQVIAAADIPVLLKDVDQKFVDAGLQKAREVTEGQVGKLVSKEKLTAEQGAEQVERTLSLITGTTSYDGFGDVDFAIEAVPGADGGQARGLRRARRRDARPRDPRLQHVRALDHRDRRRHQPPGQGRRLPLLLARLLHAPDRGRRGRGDLARRRCRRAAQLRPGDPQDAGPLRRVPRLRRQPHPHLDGVGDLALPGRDGRRPRGARRATSREAGRDADGPVPASPT